MPFNKENAAFFGSKGGKQERIKQSPETVCDKQINIKITQEKFDAFTEKAKILGLSRTQLIVRAVEAYLEGCVMKISVSNKEYTISADGIRTSEHHIVAESLSVEVAECHEEQMRKDGYDPAAMRTYYGSTVNGKHNHIHVPASVALEYDKHIETMLTERKEKQENSVKVFLSSRGWGDYSSVVVELDRRSTSEEWLEAAKAALARGFDVDQPNQTDEELMGRINAAVGEFDAEVAKKEDEKKRMLLREQEKAELMKSVADVSVSTELTEDEDGRQTTYIITVKFKDSEELVFQDRNIFDVGRVINPRYSVAEGWKPGGLINTENGKFIFMGFMSGQGWEYIRDLTENEVIAYRLISGYYGHVGSHFRM